jgi:hypothetical protein
MDQSLVSPIIRIPVIISAGTNFNFFHNANVTGRLKHELHTYLSISNCAQIFTADNQISRVVKNEVELICAMFTVPCGTDVHLTYDSSSGHDSYNKRTKQDIDVYSGIISVTLQKRIISRDSGKILERGTQCTFIV